jgi:hypothetical protein
VALRAPVRHTEVSYRVGPAPAFGRYLYLCVPPIGNIRLHTGAHDVTVTPRRGTCPSARPQLTCRCKQASWIQIEADRSVDAANAGTARASHPTCCFRSSGRSLTVGRPSRRRVRGVRRRVPNLLDFWTSRPGPRRGRRPRRSPCGQVTDHNPVPALEQPIPAIIAQNLRRGLPDAGGMCLSGSVRSNPPTGF